MWPMSLWIYNVVTVFMWSTFWPVRLFLHSFRSRANLSSQVTRLKHQKPACVCPGDDTLPLHPGMTQEVDGLHLGEAALFQRSLCVAEQLEHTSPTHTQLCVVVRVEADLKGHQQNKTKCSGHVRLHLQQLWLHWYGSDDSPGWQDYLS